MFLRKISAALLVAYAALIIYAVVGVFFQITYQPFITPLTTFVAFTFAITHSVLHLGWKKALLLLVLTFTVSLLFESLGVATGWIYGPYHYTDKLGMKFLDLVPLLIPVAWFMMTYPSFVLATCLIRGSQNHWTWRLGVAGVGAVIMTAWDLVMDPMMVAGGHWVWEEQGAYFGIPLQNFWGWWLTIFVTFFLFLSIAKIRPANRKTSIRGIEGMAIACYALTGLSNIIICLRVGLGGPGLVGLFAMLPWVVAGWLISASFSKTASGDSPAMITRESLQDE